MAGLGVGRAGDLTFDVVEGDDRSVTITLTGELDMTNVDLLASAVAPALNREPTRLIVDVRDLQFADSSAIALWVQWATAAPVIELRDPPPLLRRVIESMGLTDTLNLAP